MTPPLWQKVMKVKEESEKFGLKLNIQKTKIMASGPITSWQIDGEIVGIVADCILGGSKMKPMHLLQGWGVSQAQPLPHCQRDKREPVTSPWTTLTLGRAVPAEAHWDTQTSVIAEAQLRELTPALPVVVTRATPAALRRRACSVESPCSPTASPAGSAAQRGEADGDCSHEIKRRLLLGRKIMTNIDSILKSRDITLPTKVHLVKAMVFPVVMYGRESCTIKKAECQRNDVLNCGVGEDS